MTQFGGEQNVIFHPICFSCHRASSSAVTEDFHTSLTHTQSYTLCWFCLFIPIISLGVHPEFVLIMLTCFVRLLC